MSGNSIVDVLFKVLDLVEAERIPYYVMGGIAARTWGLPRSTFDVDLALVLEQDAVSGFCAGAERAGFSVPEIHLKGFTDTLQGMSKFSFQDVAFPKPVTVDVFLVSTPYLRAVFRRRREVEFEGRSIWMLSPEDLVLHKLMAGRTRDFSDIDDILLIQGSMDRAYLEKWAGPLGVSRLLAERIPPEAPRG